jgi:hypothetical protein
LVLDGEKLGRLINSLFEGTEGMRITLPGCAVMDPLGGQIHQHLRVGNSHTADGQTKSTAAKDKGR